ncbi:MAG: DUF4954 family protein [Chitinophagaceae bacterium]|nr:DUF4954 family protein [Chitinophagaceae bacterium]
MNIINKRPLGSIGYNFVKPEFLPPGKDEYHLRNKQNRNGIHYRQLTAFEIEVLVRNNNTSDDWNKILVSDAFNPELVKNCKFFGLVRIGKLEPYFLEFHNLRMPVGLYNSTIISSDFGDNVVIDNVNYLSHYIIGNEAIIVNVNELATANAAKFGNGIIKQGEEESIRIWLEVCNENAGRSIIPFNGMLPGDAYLWARYRDDEVMLDKFKKFTEKKFDKRRGYYGKIGDRTVIKNCKIIKDVWVGNDAYLKGANKIKNVTINSSPDAVSQIGEGCELVNGIVGYGCRIFYGVKAVRFFMASHSQLKYGARLINSYLGNNSTISCCEVLNTLIFPSHEQHHNNSFLCAALVMGQSNIAAGATIGSNHNSRSPDGEIQAGRGFWPGLCVSLKHNSKFASFNILAKGDYPAELNIPVPFALVSNDVSKDELVVMPGYWFMYNMYALTRNEWKYNARDQRIDKTQRIEFDYLAPDTVNEMFNALELFKLLTGKAYLRNKNAKKGFTEQECIETGEALLEKKDPIVNKFEITAEGFENSSRKAVMIKVLPCYHLFKELISFYAADKILQHIRQNKISSPAALLKSLPAGQIRSNWLNIGGQLVKEESFNAFRKDIHAGKIKNWDDVHGFYVSEGDYYTHNKLQHAFASLLEINQLSKSKIKNAFWKELFENAIATREWITRGIYHSREKDYTNSFRKMVYDNAEQMNKVLGKLEENSFIKMQNEELSRFKDGVNNTIALFKL